MFALDAPCAIHDPEHESRLLKVENDVFDKNYCEIMIFRGKVFCSILRS